MPDLERLNSDPHGLVAQWEANIGRTERAERRAKRESRLRKLIRKKTQILFDKYNLPTNKEYVPKNQIQGFYQGVRQAQISLRKRNKLSETCPANREEALRAISYALASISIRSSSSYSSPLEEE